jgi:hypothetical protein
VLRAARRVEAFQNGDKNGDHFPTGESTRIACAQFLSMATVREADPGYTAASPRIGLGRRASQIGRQPLGAKKWRAKRPAGYTTSPRRRIWIGRPVEF